MEEKMVTSQLEVFCQRGNAEFDPEAYAAVVESDWENGAPASVVAVDPDGRFGGLASTNGQYAGYLCLQDPDGQALKDFRWIRKNNNPTWALVFAKDADGRVWYVGRMRRQSRRHVRQL